MRERGKRLREEGDEQEDNIGLVVAERRVH